MPLTAKLASVFTTLLVGLSLAFVIPLLIYGVVVVASQAGAPSVVAICAGAITCVLLLGALHRWSRTWTPHLPWCTGLRPVEPERGFALLVALGVVAVSLDFLVAFLLGIAPSPLTPAGLPVDLKWAEALDLLILSALIPAAVEEVIFRGLMQTRLQLLLGTWPALAIVAVVFAALHLPADVHALPYLTGGLIFGGFAWFSGSVLPGFLVHAATNITIVAASRNDWTLAFSREVAIGLACLLAAVLLIGFMMGHARRQADLPH